jgi:hypothetical protein
LLRKIPNCQMGSGADFMIFSDFPRFHDLPSPTNHCDEDNRHHHHEDMTSETSNHVSFQSYKCRKAPQDSHPSRFHCTPSWMLTRSVAIISRPEPSGSTIGWHSFKCSGHLNRFVSFFHFCALRVLPVEGISRHRKLNFIHWPLLSYLASFH